MFQKEGWLSNLIPRSIQPTVEQLNEHSISHTCFLIFSMCKPIGFEHLAIDIFKHLILASPFLVVMSSLVLQIRLSKKTRKKFA